VMHAILRLEGGVQTTSPEKCSSGYAGTTATANERTADDRHRGGGGRSGD
jgi:hypothetical protein